ncbi:MAG TPA: hypothetical protein VLU25_00010 [Acidobacteriota bacterium]|nr:hypothetical protein [Acidobacteriota bacterium]
MNHFISLLLLSLCIALVFATISKNTQKERARYFLQLMGYMVLGSLVASWVMSFIPW